MTDSFDVSSNPYDGIDVERIASEELFAYSLKAKQEWVDNLLAGQGAAGVHGEHREEGPAPAPYKNTGEATNDVTISPQGEGALQYVIGGDVVQLAIAEFGRRPGAPPPPYRPIARWAREKKLTPDEGQTFEDMVNLIRWAISARGLHGFAPARAAARRYDSKGLEKRVSKRFERELEQQSIE